MKLIITSLFFFLLTAINGLAQNTEWTIASSTTSFKIKNAGFTVDGKFGPASGKIIFDDSKSSGNSIDVSIDSKTINTGNNTRDGHLKKDEYFDAEKFSKIVMKAVLFTKEANGTYKGFFKLTLKGKTKDIMVPFSFSQKDGKGKFKGSFTINRLDFGVGENSMVLSDNAIITIELNAIKK